MRYSKHYAIVYATFRIYAYEQYLLITIYNVCVCDTRAEMYSGENVCITKNLKVQLYT